jgi:hypothetical protein
MYTVESVHCKKRLAILPARESLVSDIPAGDGKLANLFLQCTGPWIAECKDIKKYRILQKVESPFSLSILSFIKWFFTSCGEDSYDHLSLSSLSYRILYEFS